MHHLFESPSHLGPKRVGEQCREFGRVAGFDGALCNWDDRPDAQTGGLEASVGRPFAGTMDTNDGLKEVEVGHRGGRTIIVAGNGTIEGRPDFGFAVGLHEGEHHVDVPCVECLACRRDNGTIEGVAVRRHVTPFAEAAGVPPGGACGPILGPLRGRQTRSFGPAGRDIRPGRCCVPGIDILGGMSAAHLLAIDQGTTSSRALVVDARGEIVGVGQKPFTQHFPLPGWVEHDPMEIWETTLASIADALRAAGITSRELAAIGITNQRETVVCWDRATGEPIGRAIVWQDRRTAEDCERLRAGGHEDAFARATGLTLDPYFSGTKLSWLLRETPGARARAERGELAAGTIDSWITWQLTGGKRHVTDYTNASRTLLFNIRKGRWDDDLCGLLDVPRALLPAAQPSRSAFGLTDEGVLGAPVPIAGIAGDQQAALFGQVCLGPGLAKNTYGTGCFLLANSGRVAVQSGNRLLCSIGANAGTSGPDYVLEGSVFVAGALVQWLRDELRIIGSSDEVEALAATVPDTGGVAIVPAFTGLGAPDWDPHARGAIFGLTRGSGAGHIARAALEAIALSSAELLQAMNADLPQPVAELRVDGGAARNDLLMQLQADFAGIPVVRPTQTETTALGAAYLAGLGVGIWSAPEEIAGLWQPERTFEPATGDSERSDRLAGWRRAVERTLGWATPR